MNAGSGNFFDEQEACHIIESIKMAINSNAYGNANGNPNR
jgi:hypothetical protein